MGLIAVASAKGSPGVTTTALLLGGLWPRPAVVAECDPSGADIALRLPAVDGGVLEADRGLLSLAAAGRKSLRPELVLEHSQQVVGGQDVLLGVRVPEQAGGLSQVWHQLGELFTEVAGYDVIADCGRVGMSTPQNALLSAASDVVFCVDAMPSNVIHLRERIAALQGALRPDAPTGTRVHVAVVAEPRRTQPVKEVEEALERADLAIGHVVHLAHDPKGARFFAGVVEGNPARTQLVRSALPVAAQLAHDTEPFFVATPPSEQDQPAQPVDEQQLAPGGAA